MNVLTAATTLSHTGALPIEEIGLVGALAFVPPILIALLLTGRRQWRDSSRHSPDTERDGVRRDQEDHQG